MAAKQTPGQPSEPNAAAKALHDQFSKLKEVIAEIPLHVLTDRARKEMGLETPAEELDIRAQEIIGDLSTLARIGDQFAIKSLLKIGLIIANELEFLAGSSSDSSPEDDAEKDWRDEETAESHPVRFADAVVAMAQNSMVNIRVIEKSVENLGQSFLPVSSEAISANPSLSVVEIERDEVQSGRCVKDAPTRLVVESIVSMLVSRHLLKVAKAKAREIASSSRSWPINLSAFSDYRRKNVETILKKMELGYALPFRLNPIVKPRFEAGSPSEFALDVCLTLEDERQKGMKISASHRKELEKEECLYKKDPNAPALRNRWAPWLRKAVLLPAFSSDPEVRKLWIAAGMAWADNYCAGNWDEAVWPSSVEERKFNEKEQRHRATKPLVEIALRRGMEALEKLSQEGN